MIGLIIKAQTTLKANKSLNILKALTGSTWGHDSDTLTTTYKAIIRSVINYASPAWSTIISPTNLNKLQITQNKALRITTGNVSISPLNHLHAETKILPLFNHFNMLNTQYISRILLANHPNFQLNHSVQPLRPKKTYLTPQPNY